MKNRYVKPELELIGFSAIDIICSSIDGEPEMLITEINSKEAEAYGSSAASMFDI